MNFSTRLKLVVTSVFLAASSTAIAQESQDDEADVWGTIEDQWDAEGKGDKEWLELLLTENFSGWGNSSPAPRSKSSTMMWDRFGDEQGRMVEHELYLLAIIVEGDLAVAHYLYSSAYEDKDKDVEMNHGRYTDVLGRTDQGWKFIAWHGGDDD